MILIQKFAIIAQSILREQASGKLVKSFNIEKLVNGTVQVAL